MVYARIHDHQIMLPPVSGLKGTKNTAMRNAVAGRSQRWYKCLLECSLQDLIGIYMPYMVLVSQAAVGACYIYDPTSKLLLYSALPERYQSWLIFLMCFVEEMRFITIFIGVAVQVLQLQVISFDLININLEAILDSTTKGYPYFSC